MEVRNRRRGLSRHRRPAGASVFTEEDLAKIHRDANKGASKRRRRGNAFTQIGPARFVTLSQLHQDTLKLVGRIPADVDTIIGVARSGLAVATMVSMLLHKPLMVFQHTNKKLVAAGNGWRLGGSSHIEPHKQKVAVIDDTCMTGNSTRDARRFISQFYPEAVYCAVYVNPLAKVKPDIWVRDLAWPHLLEWNVFNSILSPNMALDFDGILCDDCPPGWDDDGRKYLEFIETAQPKYLPRKVPVGLIVTARIEKYRKATEDWLKRHGVQYRQLIMHPATDLATRRRDDIAMYKAQHFKAWSKVYRPNPPPLLFFESEDGQAKRIHEISKLMTVCPASGQCYG